MVEWMVSVKRGEKGMGGAEKRTTAAAAAKLAFGSTIEAKTEIVCAEAEERRNGTRLGA